MTVINVHGTLIASYLRRGHERRGEIEPFPHGDNRFGKPLRDDLGLVVLGKRLDRQTLVAAYSSHLRMWSKAAPEA
ncbi:hypothetical protein [Rhizobium sp. SG570]|uniref:hypothetical protein n=1 Tax=Rhizobium sp. SG570 TaxID=2587113 RepID=UPI0014480E13|nr:hypothetical protein [Rhizobium sp. SG570]NKJ39535.1 hypothetical protein [Rhizobium sp. SG570]